MPFIARPLTRILQLRSTSLPKERGMLIVVWLILKLVANLAVIHFLFNVSDLSDLVQSTTCYRPQLDSFFCRSKHV